MHKVSTMTHQNIMTARSLLG